MFRLTEVRLPLDHDEAALKHGIVSLLGVASEALGNYEVFRRAIDARKKSSIVFSYTVDFAIDPAYAGDASIVSRLTRHPQVSLTPDMEYRFVAEGSGLARKADFIRPLVIGAGPCGLFATLLLAQMGFRPILLERGKEVRQRTKDTWSLWREGKLNPESNVQFGEGGAGTFSDGKLYSQIKDPRYLARKVLSEFVNAGAPAEILYIAKPHIGTFRLVSMVEHMRATIESLGGEIRFEKKVSDFEISEGKLQALHLQGGERIATRHVVLAVGHSARDTFEALHARGVFIEPKPFSIGVRIEHPQSLIDRSRYGKFADHPMLGAADYKLVHHCSNGRSAYSFCMCPGGTVVAATSEVGRVVTNGMSQYSRNERNANSGIVVGIAPEKDYPGGPLAGIEYQRHWESRAYLAGGSTYAAPAQLIGDFLAGRASTALGSVLPSYQPGVCMTDLAACLPDYAVNAIREALPAFDKQIAGFSLHDVVMTGVETRTSSPLRIRRDDHFQSVNTAGLYPAGEGAGYAGGILSAGVDGIRVAEAIALSLCAGAAGTTSAA